MITQNHIIHRINLDIGAPPGTDGQRFQDMVLRILYDQILPRLGKELDALAAGSDHIRISEMNLDLGKIRKENLEEELILRLQQQLMMKLMTCTSPNGKIFRPAQEERNPGFAESPAEEQESSVKFESLTPERQMLDIFIFYLKTGQLPWYCDGSDMLPVGEAVTGALYKLSAGDRNQLKNFLAFDSKALTRLIMQYDRTVVTEILTMLLAPSAGMKMETLKKGIASLTEGEGQENFREIYITKIHFLLRSVRIDEAALSVLDKQFPWDMEQHPESKVSRNRDIPLKPKKEDKQKITGIAEAIEQAGELWLSGEGVLVTHAGLIILHPFMEYLFREFGLLEGDLFRDRESCMTAVQLLGYLATGEDGLYEYDLTLEKYLCGIGYDIPVLRKSLLTPAMKTEAANLLKAAIAHWKELKKTSPGGLRQGFLIRRGKLVAGSFGHRLLIEKASQDILLSWLPWGISLVKLPWLCEILHVEWN
jgi:hypothetical protein